MCSKYLVVCDRRENFPSRVEWLDRAWGEVPVSYVQDGEELRSTSYLDVKVNKWELNSGWSGRQVDEPWIRIEFFRDNFLKSFVEENAFPFDLDFSSDMLLVFELDDGWLDVDKYLIENIVCVLSEKCRCYLWRGRFELLGREYFKNIPSKIEVKNMLIDCQHELKGA